MSASPARFFSAIVFDLDGTLIDSAPDVRQALNRMLAERGLGPLALVDVQQMVGEGTRVLIEKAFQALNVPLPEAEIQPIIDRYLEFYRADPASHTHVFDGVAEALAALAARGVKLGICTNKPQQLTGMVLDRLGLAPYFGAVVGGDHPRRKPDGDHVLETLRRLGVAPAEAAVVGDSPTDVAAARDARLPVVAVTFGYAKMDPAQLGADRLVARFSELGAALDSLAAEVLGA